MSETNHLLNQTLNDRIDELSEYLKFLVEVSPDDEKIIFISQLEKQIIFVREGIEQIKNSQEQITENTLKETA